MKIIKSVFATAAIAAFAIIIANSACKKETTSNEEPENIEAVSAMSSAMDSMVIYHDSMIHANDSHRVVQNNHKYHHHDSVFQHHHKVYHHGDTMGHHSGSHPSSHHKRHDSITTVHHNFPH